MAMNMNIAQIQAMAADLGARTLGQVGSPVSPHAQYKWVLGGWRPAVLARQQIMSAICGNSPAACFYVPLKRSHSCLAF